MSNESAQPAVPSMAKAVEDYLTELNTQAQRAAQLEAEIAALKRENYQLRDHNGKQDKQITTLRANVATLKDVARFFRAQRDRVDAYLSGVTDTHREQHAAQYGPTDLRALEEKVVTVSRETDQMLRRFGSNQSRQRPNVNEPFAQNHAAVDDAGFHVYQAYRDQEPKGWEEL